MDKASNRFQALLAAIAGEPGMIYDGIDENPSNNEEFLLMKIGQRLSIMGGAIYNLERRVADLES